MLWILSQDRSLITNVKTVCFIEERGKEKWQILSNTHFTDFFSIGNYETESRAKDVLAKIFYLLCAVKNTPITYEMPLE